MNLFDEQGESRIIINEKFLQSEHFPAQILGREKEINSLAYSVKSFLRSKSPQHMFVYGSPGTGKTTCASHVMNQLEEHTSAVIPVYVNCWKCSTSLSVYSEISTAMKMSLPRRGVAMDEIANRVNEIIEKENHRFVLVLDEIDGLVKNGSEFLYFASRSSNFNLIGISNKMDAVASLDQRIRSSLHFETLKFENYSYLDLRSILAERAKNALTQGSWDDQLIEAIAKKSANSGDARLAINLLFNSAKSAEKRNANKIGLEDVPRDSNLTEHRIEDKALSENEQLIIGLLKTGEKTSTEIYNEFTSRKISLSKRQIRTYIDSLIEKNLISEKEIETGSFLKPRIFSLL